MFSKNVLDFMNLVLHFLGRAEATAAVKSLYVAPTDPYQQRNFLLDGMRVKSDLIRDSSAVAVSGRRTVSQ